MNFKILIDLIINWSKSSDSENEDSKLIRNLLSCLLFYCSKLRKRVDYIKNPSTFCSKGFFLKLKKNIMKILNFKTLLNFLKDFYSCDFEKYSRLIYSSANFKKNLTTKAKKNENLLNKSLYSESIIS